VFPGSRGAHVNLRNFRRREWKPALEAASGPAWRIYDLRSTFASHALAAGVSVYELARIMGTSVQMTERRRQAAAGSGNAIRGKLDAYVWGLGQESATASGQSSGD
jgi:integrase